MKTKSMVVAIALIISFLGCNAQNEKEEANFPELKGPYLGQKPPGMILELFAPEVISHIGSEENDINFWPNGEKCIFNRNEVLYETQLKNGKWTIPKPFKPLENINCFEPGLTPSGNKIFFGNKELKLPKDVSKKAVFGPLWFIEETTQGWSKPIYFTHGMFPSIERNGTVYFTALTGLMYRDQVSGEYKQSIPLFSGSYMEDAHPSVAPDGSYIIFDSELRSRINNCRFYVTFKLQDGTWSVPVNMGKIDSIPTWGLVRISSDQKYIFFCDEGNIYWISSKIIEELKPKNLK